MRKAVANRRVFPYLAFITVVLGLVAGFVVTLIDRRDFPTFGTGVWWAIVTLGTVGYGDVVPHTGWGRVVGSAVIVRHYFNLRLRGLNVWPLLGVAGAGIVAIALIIRP